MHGVWRTVQSAGANAGVSTQCGVYHPARCRVHSVHCDPSRGVCSPRVLRVILESRGRSWSHPENSPRDPNSLFCCPERLNGAHCLSVGHHWQSESPQRYRVNLETCGPWYVRSEWPWEIFGFLEGFQVFWGIFGWFSEFRKLLDDFQILENFRF